MIEPVVIGIGGNIGSEAELVTRFRHAREALALLGDLRSAPLYRTAAIGPAQAAFLNTAVRIRIADLQPGELIATVLEIELLLGRDRDREARWGPRPLDLDVLVWGGRRIQSPALEVPHPRLAERRFALAPLIDLLGEDVHIPGAGRAGDLLARVRHQPIELVAETW